MELFDIFVISEVVEQIIVVGFPHVNNINRPCHSINYIGKCHLLLLFITLISFQNSLSFLLNSFLARESFFRVSSLFLINRIAPLNRAFVRFFMSNNIPCLGDPESLHRKYASRDISYKSEANSFHPGRLKSLPLLTPGAKTINVFRACLGAQLTICAQK